LNSTSVQSNVMTIKQEITIYDIARALNISTSTVNRGLGFQHNPFVSNLRKNRIHTLGPILPCLDRYFQSTGISGIEKAATQNGMEQGCKRIVHLGGYLKCPVYRDRYNGYKKAHKDHSIPIDPDLASYGLLNQSAGLPVSRRPGVYMTVLHGRITGR